MQLEFCVRNGFYSLPYLLDGVCHFPVVRFSQTRPGLRNVVRAHFYLFTLPFLLNLAYGHPVATYFSAKSISLPPSPDPRKHISLYTYLLFTVFDGHVRPEAGKGKRSEWGQKTLDA